jgi:serpin B
MLHTEADATNFLSALDTLRIFLEASTGAQGDQWSMANGAWFADDVRLRQDFVASVRSTPADTVAAMDFSSAPESSRNAINRWIREGTHGKVRELLAPGSIRSSTALVLANATYLHARWPRPFEVRQTVDETFWVKGTDSTNVPTMHSTMEMPYGADENAQVVRLDYRGRDIGLVIVLPRFRDGSRVEGRLTHASKRFANPLLRSR